MSAETVVDLTYPIQIRGGSVSRLTLRRPRVKDLRLLDGAAGEVERTATLIGALCALDRSEVDLIDAQDFALLGSAVADFLPGAPATGAT
jgi:hypothetical protein